MNIRFKYTEPPKCRICRKQMNIWNPYTDIHEHQECSVNKISNSLIDFIKIELCKPKQ